MKNKNANQPRHKNRVIRRTVLALGLVVAALIVFVLWYSNHLLDKINYASDDEVTHEALTDEERAALEAPDDVTPDVSTDDTEIEMLEDALSSNLEQEDESVQDIPTEESVINILLIGSDSRTGDNWSRSDTMIIFSINEITKKIILTSLMRDIYLSIPGYGNNRINAAYAYGGPDLLMETIEENFKIKIDNYMTVDFYSFMDIADILGGTTIDVSYAEMKNMNRIIQSINYQTGTNPDAGKLSQAGTQHLNGIQTLAYARVRYVGNADFERTQRQREVINQMLDKAKKMSLKQLNDTLNAVLPEIQTNFSKGEILSLMLAALEYKDYEVTENRVPTDSTFTYMNIRGMAVLGIDIEENIQVMNNAIYG